MRRGWMTFSVFGFFVLLLGILPVLAGDSLYGKIIKIRSAELVIMDYGAGQYVIHIIGIVTPKEGPLTKKALEFVSKLVLGKNARMRFESRNKNGEMMARLLTGDAKMDVGLELVKAGLAKRQPDYDYKYGELSKAENEARKAKRGLWK